MKENKSMRTNPFDVTSVALTKLEWRYILHALRICKQYPDGAEETNMNEHCKDSIEKASE